MNALNNQQPNFQNWQQPYYPQRQIPQQPVQQFGFSGRYINDINEVRLDEVPMNGQPCFFPTRDASAVYLKVWNQNGQLLTVRYILDQEQPGSEPNATTDSMDDVYTRLTRLEEALATTKSRKRKDVMSQDGS